MTTIIGILLTALIAMTLVDIALIALIHKSNEEN